MANEAIVLEYIYIILKNANSFKFTNGKKLTTEFQKEINEKCPKGYKYKETISIEKTEFNRTMEAIVAYEQIPR